MDMKRIHSQGLWSPLGTGTGSVASGQIFKTE